MLSFAQAMTISRRCIKAVSGAKNLTQEEILDAAGITDTDRVELLKRLVCVSESIGVPSKGHTLRIQNLSNITRTKTVGDLAETISKQAEEA